MNYFVNVIKRELLKIKRNKFILFSLFVAPVLLSLCVVWTFSEGILTKLPIAVLDNDNSDVTRAIIRAVDATPSVNVKYRIENVYEGQDLIKSGKAYALIIFPHNFKKDLDRSKRPQISYYYNNQMIIVGGSLTKDIQAAIATTIKGIDAQIRMKQGLARDAAISQVSLIGVDERVKSNPYLNYSYFLTYASFAHIYQIFVTLLAIWALGIEFREGTTKQWLECANNSVLTAVFGKLFVYGTILLILMFLSFFSYTILYGAPFRGNFLYCLFSSVVYLFSYQMMGLCFVAVLSNMRFALSCGAFYTSLGFSMAGMTFPATAMPAFGRFYSSLLPVRPYVNLIIDQMMKGFAPKYDLNYLFWILCIGLFGASFIPLLHKHLQDEKLWYQI